MVSAGANQQLQQTVAVEWRLKIRFNVAADC